MTHEETDVLVVGGGPGGLLAAETVAGAGFPAILIERDSEIGLRVRTTGGMSLSAMTEFCIPEELYHPIRRVRVCSHREETQFEFDQPIGCVIDVRGVYKHLASRAASKGARVIPGMRALHPLLEGNRVVGCMAMPGDSSEPVEIRAKILIDASGYRSVMSRQALLHSGYGSFGVGSEYDMVAPNCHPDEVVLVVSRTYAPSGYAWVFPWGKGRVRVGVGTLHPDEKININSYLRSFIENAAAFGIDLTAATIAEHHYGMIPADGIAKHLVGDGIMTVGDAAGQANLVTGAGVRTALTAGRLAGTCAVQALLNDRSDRAALQQYERAFKSRYGRHRALGRMVGRRLAKYDNAGLDDIVRLLKTIPGPRFVQLCRSEFSLSDILSWTTWIAKRPSLWPGAVRLGLHALRIVA